MKEIKKRILENAGDIQNALNYLESCNSWYINNYREIVAQFNDGVYMEATFNKKVSSFILKGRTLKSGLKTPMARYYAWKHINKNKPLKVCARVVFEDDEEDTFFNWEV